MEPEQWQQQLPRRESHNHQHIWAAFPHRNGLEEPPPQKTSPLPAGDVLPGGAKGNLGFAGGWGLCGAHPCDATDPVRERAPSKPLLPRLSMREALSIHPHSHVCVGWRGSEPQQGQGTRGKPGKGTASILPFPYQAHGPAPHGSSRTLEEAEGGWNHVPLSLHPPVGLPQWGG